MNAVILVPDFCMNWYKKEVELSFLPRQGEAYEIESNLLEVVRVTHVLGGAPQVRLRYIGDTVWSRLEEPLLRNGFEKVPKK